MSFWKTQIDGPVSVVGDVHGQVEKLEAILGQLSARPDYQERWIVFIGDLVDRGTNPKAVLDVVQRLRREHPRTTAIMGNHEMAMLAALGWIPVPEYSEMAGLWVEYYDAQSTFDSYGVPLGDLAQLADKVPAEHREMLVQLPWCVEHPQFVFVHAGLDPNMPYAVQSRILQQRDFSLARPPWLCSKTFTECDGPGDCRKTVVSGHVPQEQVVIRPRRILTDTTGGWNGDLSCVLLPERKVITSGGSGQPERTAPKPSSTAVPAPRRADAAPGAQGRPAPIAPSRSGPPKPPTAKSSSGRQPAKPMTWWQRLLG